MTVASTGDCRDDRTAYDITGGSRSATIFATRARDRSIALAIEPSPLSPAWENRCGTWSVANPDPDPFVDSLALGFDPSTGFATISVAVASVPEPVVLPVESRDDTTLVVSGMGRHMGETLTATTAGSEQIHWSGLVFERAQ